MLNDDGIKELTGNERPAELESPAGEARVVSLVPESAHPADSKVEVWSRPLLRAARDLFRCDWHGFHGIRHWYNVRNIAHKINQVMPSRYKQSADPLVLDLFALFHDLARLNEYTDRGHGGRGGELAKQFRGQYFDCSDRQMELLLAACEGHEYGKLSTDPTVGVCWDADRLDLNRVGIWPDEKFMSFPKASIYNCAMKTGLNASQDLRDRIDRRRQRARSSSVKTAVVRLG